MRKVTRKTATSLSFHNPRKTIEKKIGLLIKVTRFTIFYLNIFQRFSTLHINKLFGFNKVKTHWDYSEFCFSSTQPLFLKKIVLLIFFPISPLRGALTLWGHNRSSIRNKKHPLPLIKEEKNEWSVVLHKQNKGLLINNKTSKF